MNRWKVILAVTIIFVAGSATGGALVRAYAPKIVKRTVVSPWLPVTPERRQEYISKLDREVELNSEQRIQIEEIVAASQERLKQIWEPFEPQATEEYRRCRREISEALTPEQREKFKHWRKDKDNKSGKRGKDESTNSPSGKPPC